MGRVARPTHYTQGTEPARDWNQKGQGLPGTPHRSSTRESSQSPDVFLVGHSSPCIPSETCWGAAWGRGAGTENTLA